MIKEKKKTTEKRICYLCFNNLKDVDYRNAQVLRRFVSSYMKIAPKRRSGLCNMHQRKVSMAIKRAREMALLPYLAR